MAHEKLSDYWLKQCPFCHISAGTSHVDTCLLIKTARLMYEEGKEGEVVIPDQAKIERTPNAYRVESLVRVSDYRLEE